MLRTAALESRKDKKAEGQMELGGSTDKTSACMVFFPEDRTMHAAKRAAKDAVIRAAIHGEAIHFLTGDMKMVFTVV